MSSPRRTIERRSGKPPRREEPDAQPPAEDLLDLPLGSKSQEPELGFGGRATDDDAVRPGEDGPSEDALGAGLALGGGESGGSGDGFSHGAPAPRSSGAQSRGQNSHSQYASVGGARRSPSRWPIVLLLLLLPVAAAAGYFLRPLPPISAVSMPLLEYGEVRLGQSTMLELSLRNAGESPLTFQALVIDGAEKADFQLGPEAEACLGRPLVAAEECLIRVAFSPASSGRRAATLQVQGDQANGQQFVPLRGRGVAPELEVEPAELDFGEQTVGYRGSRLELFLRNRGSADLDISTVFLEGPAAADFVRFADRCSGTSLAPSASCSIRFEFVPTAAGERQASLRVDSDANQNSGLSRFVGVGIPQQPLLGLDPERLDFGAMRVGESTPVQEVRLVNDGNGPLEIRSLSVVASGSAEEDESSAKESFQVESDCSGHLLAPEDGCELKVFFQPRREDSISAVVEIVHSAGDGLHRVPLVGRGIAPHLRVEPAKISFGEVAQGRGAPGKGTRAKPLTLSNTGSAPLKVASIKLVGADATAFELVSVCGHQTIAAGSSCRAEVQFAPRRDGPHRAEVLVTHDADGGTDRLAVNGLGTSAKLSLDPARLEFATVRTGEERRLELRLSNDGRAPLEIESMKIVGEGFELLRGCAGRTLGPRGSCVASIRFATTKSGNFRARLVIAHDAATQPNRVDLTGTANEPPKPALAVEPQSVEFYDRPIGQGGVAEMVTLSNPGNGPLTLREIEVGGLDAGDFRRIAGSCDGLGSLAAGSQCTLGIEFTPSGDGQRSAVLVIRHNAVEGSFRLPLRGRGIRVSVP